MRTLIISPQLLSTPDAAKISEHLNGLIEQVKLSNPTAKNEVGAIVGGLITLLCMKYDAQVIHDLIKQLVNKPNFWKELADLKKLKVSP